MHRDKDIELWEKLWYIKEIKKKSEWKTVKEDELISIKIFTESKYSPENPICKLSMKFNNKLHLKNIIDAICKYEERKNWDTSLQKLEVYEDKKTKKQFMHTVFEYSNYKAEFLERKIVALHEKCVIIGLHTSDKMFEYQKDSLVSKSYFSVYVISEKKAKTHISIYLHFDISSPLLIVCKKLACKKLELWCKSLQKYLE